MLIWGMALSRIWAAFILVSIVVAGVRYACVPADKEIFSTMVTGRAGDTVRVETAAGTVGASAAPGYRVQRADGIIGTCSTAVTLAIGLIGIMALFMGLVSIAEAAGGCGSSRGSPHLSFRACSRTCPKAIRPWAIW